MASCATAATMTTARVEPVRMVRYMFEGSARGGMGPQNVRRGRLEGMSLDRLIDAACNRACEGLRTLEDLARFLLDDAAAVEQFKAVRHEIRAALKRAWPGNRAPWHRDTAGDVGTDLVTSGESVRTGAGDVACAATGRATEALRSLEEVAKVDAPATAATFEALRYRVYDLGASLERRLGTGARQWRLCLLLTESACTLPWVSVLGAAIDGGVDCVQVRETGLDDAALLTRIAQVLDICRPRNVPVIVNDRVDIALVCGAQGVHLGRDDLPVDAARQLAGRRLIIGASTHGPEEAAEAVASGVDYVGIGPIFASATKAHLEPSGIERIRLTLPVIGDLPHLVIGGITPETAGAASGAGARGLAVSEALCAAADPRGVAESLLMCMAPVSRDA